MEEKFSVSKLITQRWIPMTVFMIALCGVIPAQAATSYVPLVFRQDSGTRPFVEAKLNGKPLLMMVHANADLYAMTTHAHAAEIGVGPLTRQDDYGITSTGHASTLGRSKTKVSSFQVAGPELHDTPLSVFEIPQDPPTDGMLGIQWLREQKVIVDYDQARLGVSDTMADAKKEDSRLVASGYVAHRMRWDPALQRYRIDGVFDGKPVSFTVGTVAENVVDAHFAAGAGIQLGPIVADAGGPRGAVVPMYLVKRPAHVLVDGQPVQDMQPRAFDISGYAAGKSHPTIDIDFLLGADFMLANQAIVDFGTGVLLISPRREP